MDTKRIRYPLLDDIRGITLISMMFFHAMWDIVYIYNVPIDWYRSKGAYVWQQSICWTFILLSGFCWSFGHRKWKRGLTVFAAGALVTLVTLVFMPEDRVVFGVLTLLGTSMLLMIPIERVLRFCKPVIGMLCSGCMFLLFRNVNVGFLGFEGWSIAPLPECLYSNLFMTFLGFTEKSFYSTDYFSIFPWFFLFAFGYFMNRYCVERDRLRYLKHNGIKVFEEIGKHSLLIYMLHQPLIYGVLYVVMNIGNSSVQP